MKKLLHQILRVAGTVLESGGEISRVEESITRMCAAYGAQHTHVYATTSQISATVETEEENYTETYRPGRIQTNMERLDRANSLVRHISQNAPKEEEIRKQVADIATTPSYPFPLLALAQGAVAGSFCIFFGARTVAEFFLAFLIGTALGFLSHVLYRIGSNRLLNCFALSFLSSLAAFLAARWGMIPTPDYIVIGYIMNLIPGIGFTGALRDLFVGDVFTGMSRIMESLLLAASIAFGFVLTMLLFGGVA